MRPVALVLGIALITAGVAALGWPAIAILAGASIVILVRATS